MKTTRIFLDVDGVLADWVGACAGLFGRDPATLDWSQSSDMAVALGVSTNTMWRRIDGVGPSFWAGLDPYPWTMELWERARDVAPTVLLTSPSHHPSSLDGKLRWMNRVLGGGKPFRDFLVGPRKEFCASPGSLLIDDRASMCRLFREHGGEAVVFPRPWNVDDDATDPDDPMLALDGIL